MSPNSLHLNSPIFSCIIYGSAQADVQIQNFNGFLPQNVPCDIDPAILQGALPTRKLRSLIEPDAPGVLIPGTAYQP